MKKLLILGGDHFTIPVVEAAKKQGYYTITCDYLPDNVAHKCSDEYVNFSTTDKEGILSWARNKKIDGIVTLTDSGEVTCAYVAHHLGLPMTGPLESVEILQNKDKFRKFLADNNFNVPKAKGYSNIEEAIVDKDIFDWPIIVKPVDSAGSKGVTKVEHTENLKEAINYALDFSPSKRFIIEEFIEKEGCSSDSDCFSVNGEMRVVSFSSQYFDENAVGIYTPAAFSWPTTMSIQACNELKEELQRLLELLQMRTSIYNVETRVGINGKPYIMEVSPRGGGNRLAEMVRYSTGVDMITAAVRAAVGDDICLSEEDINGYWAEIILHADNTGIFDKLIIDPSISKSYVQHVDLWVNKGDHVEAFSGANKAIGTMVMRFNEIDIMETMIKNQREWLKVVTK